MNKFLRMPDEVKLQPDLSANTNNQSYIPGPFVETAELGDSACAFPAEIEEAVSSTLFESNIFLRARDKGKEKWIGANVKTFLFAGTIAEEYRGGIENAVNGRDKFELRSTTALAVGGQAYERGRLPETFGVSLATNIYREITERGHPTWISTIAGSIALGAFVYGQQKIIGKNWIKTTVHYPKTYDTAKQFWPRTTNKVDETLPDISHPVQQGVAMVSLGNTPFIATARAKDPSITTDKLEDIERKVTRRGSIAASAMGGLVLGAVSAAPHMPSRIWRWNTEWLPEKMITGSDTIVDTLSDPKKVLIGFFGIALLQGGLASLNSRFGKNK